MHMYLFTPTTLEIHAHIQFNYACAQLWLAQRRPWFSFKIGGTSIRIKLKGDVGMSDQQKMIETRHGLESNLVPTSIFAPKS